jgi:hypothetical protein
MAFPAAAFSAIPVVENLEQRRTDHIGTFVFPGQGEDNAFGSFPSHWKHIFEESRCRT